MTSSLLIMIAPAPIEELPDGRLRLDVKFVEGMRLHKAHWNGPVRVILWRGGDIPFGKDFYVDDLGFDLLILEQNKNIEASHLVGAKLVVASGDMHEALNLPMLVKASGGRLVYGIEYTLDTRLQIVRLDQNMPWPRKVRSMLWHLNQERRRRAAFRAADGIQANGWPAEAAYGHMSRNCLLYLDGRMRSTMMATQEETAMRTARLATGAPLRIVHSGRLEPLKGAQDLIPVARTLVEKNVNFTLDIWGAGSLAPQIEQEILVSRLEHQVRLHKPVSFETELMPIFRRNGDLFLSCHRQSDPSCSYIEAMGCGLPVIGYANSMWRSMLEKSGGGAQVPMGDYRALAHGIAQWSCDRVELIDAGKRALSFATSHDFETEFERRMDHLKSIAY